MSDKKQNYDDEFYYETDTSYYGNKKPKVVVPKQDVKKEITGRLALQVDKLVIKGDDNTTYHVEGDANRFKSLVAHELLFTVIIRNPAIKEPRVKILNYI